MSVGGEIPVIVDRTGRGDDASPRPGVWLVSINRAAARNAVDGPTAAALLAVFREFEAAPEARVAVLRGIGGSFCAGADLKSSIGIEAAALTEEGDVGPLGPTRLLLSKPVIAAVSGYAVAGGLELALWCDLRVVDDDAVFGVFCRRWGVPLIDGGTIRLPRLVGLSVALDMILTGRPVPAAEAKAIGLANRVVPRGTSTRAALDLAASLVAFPQVAMNNDRLSAYEQHDKPLREALANEFRRGYKALEAEAAEGMKRFARGEGRHGAFGGPAARL